jgi:hypothetical protein
MGWTTIRVDFGVEKDSATCYGVNLAAPGLFSLRAAMTFV